MWGKRNHCWWECKLVHLLWKTVWKILKKFERELPYDPLLDIYPKKMKTQIRKDICTPMFIAELFTVAKIRKQSRAPGWQGHDLVAREFELSTLSAEPTLDRLSPSLSASPAHSLSLSQN